MSRTIRRKNLKPEEFSNYSVSSNFYASNREIANLYNDKLGGKRINEKGPKDFRRSTMTKPNRQLGDKEIRKYMTNEEHEVMSNQYIKDKEYWS